MENASKALFMVAGVMLGIMLLSVMIYLFRAGASVNEKYDSTQSSESLELYNSKFTNYDRSLSNGDINTIADMVTVMNLAYDVNKSSNYDEGNYVEIYITIGTNKYGTVEPNSTITLNRNEIYDYKNGKVISIYTLMNSTIGELGITGFGTSTDKLNESILTSAVATSGSRGYLYKYAFDSKSDAIEYHSVNGKIAKMEFQCSVNNDYPN
jgi:hypothetical protein